ncbi:unnamed protein product, partial [marine sediment metagenome]
WYQLLAKAGWREAQLIVGNNYLNGEIVKKNKRKGLEWIRKAALSEYYPAIVRLVELDKGGVGNVFPAAEKNVWTILNNIAKNIAIVMQKNPQVRI